MDIELVELMAELRVSYDPIQGFSRPLREGVTLYIYPATFGKWRMSTGPTGLPIYDDTW